MVETLTFLSITAEYNQLTILIYVIIMSVIVLGLFSARQKKFGTCKPIRTLFVNSLISYVALLILIEYSYLLKTTDIKLIILCSFMVGLAADGISTQVVKLMENISVKNVFSKLFDQSDTKYVDSNKNKKDKN